MVRSLLLASGPIPETQRYRHQIVPEARRFTKSWLE